jgi:hypothetical protein
MGFMDGFYQVLGHFLGLFWMWGMFRLSQMLFADYKLKVKTFIVILGISLLLGFLSWSSLGTHVEDSDPLVGGGETVTDYEPTHSQRNKAGTFIFLLSFLPACAGLLLVAKSTDSKSDKRTGEVHNPSKPQAG